MRCFLACDRLDELLPLLRVFTSKKPGSSYTMGGDNTTHGTNGSIMVRKRNY